MPVFSGLPSDSPLTFRSRSLMYLGTCAVCGPGTCDAGYFCLVLWQRSGCPCIEVVRHISSDVKSLLAFPTNRRLYLSSWFDSALLSRSGFARPQCK